MDNNQTLLSFGVDQKSLKASIKEIVAGLRSGIETSLTNKPIKLPKIDISNAVTKGALDLSEIKLKGFINIPIEKIRWTGGSLDLATIPVKGKINIPTSSVNPLVGSPAPVATSGTGPVSPVDGTKASISNAAGDQSSLLSGISNLKAFAFNIGLVGYAMENLGKKFLAASANILSFIESSAKATEGIQRLQNFTTQLVQEGAIDPTKRTFILSEIRRIAEMPGGSFDTIIHAFNALNTLGVSYSENLRLIAGLQNSVARSGDTTVGIPTIVKLFERAKATEKVQGRSLVQVIDTSGKDIQDAFNRAFGGADEATLEQFTWGQLITRLIPELEKVPRALATSQDRVERINIAWTYMKDAILGIADVALDNLLVRLKSVEGILVELRKRFDALSPEKQNFISTLLSAIPVVIGAIGLLLSTLGVLALSLAVFTKVSVGWEAGMLLIAKSTGATTEVVNAAGKTVQVISKDFSLLGTITSKIGGLFTGAAEGASALAIAGEGAEVATTGIAIALGRAVGFIPGIGTLVNLILAYATNAGSARDVINEAFSNLFTSIKTLFDHVSKFFAGPGKGILDLITLISNLIGSLLGGALAVILGTITDIINLINSFFDLLEAPNTENWKKFGTAFFQALVGTFDRLGKVLAASFISAIADGLSGPPDPRAPTRGPDGQLHSNLGPGDTLDPATGIITRAPKSLEEQIGSPKFFGGKSGGGVNAAVVRDLRSAATILRGSLSEIGLNVTGSTDLIATSLEKSTEETKKLNLGLDKTQKIIDGMSVSLEKASVSFAKVNADIALANVKFRNAQDQREAAERLNLLIKSKGEGAIPDINANEAKTNQQSISEITAANKLELPALAIQLQLTGKALDSAFDSLNPLIFGDAANKVGVFRVALGKVIDLALTGKATLNDFGSAFTSLGTKYADLQADIPLQQDDKGRAQIKSVLDAYREVLPAIVAYNAKLGEQKLYTDKITNTNERDAEAQRAAAKAQQKRADAVTAALPNQLKLAELEKQHQLDLVISAGKAGQTKKEIDAANAREIEYQKTRNATTQIIANNLNAEDDLVKTRTENTNLQVRAINDAGAASQRALQDQLEFNNSLTESFKNGFASLEEFRQKLNDVNDTRAKLGFSPGNSLPNLDIGAKLNSEIIPLTNLNRKLPGDNAVDVEFEVMVDHIKMGLPLIKKFQDDLVSIGQVTGETFVKSETAITNITAKITQLRSQPQTADTTEELQTALDEQTRLGEQSKLYSNRLIIINAILGANVRLIDDQYKKTVLLQEAERSRLNIEQETLRLKTDYLNKQQELENKKAQGPGPMSDLFKLQSVSDADAKRASDVQLKSLMAKYKLDLLSIEATKDKIKAEVDLGHIKKEQGDELIKSYDAQEDILTRIYNLDVKGVDFDTANKSARDYKNTLTGLVDSTINKLLVNFSHNLQTAANNQKGSLTTMQRSAMLFKDIAAVAFVGAFESMGEGLIKFLESGKEFLSGIGQFFGSLLMTLGETIIQLSLAAVATAFITEFMHDAPIWGAWIALGMAASAAAAVVPFAAVGVAAGAGLILAGRAMGGQGKYSSSASTSNANTANSANSQAGAQGENFDPNKDPKTIYQKALKAQILIDIRTDDTQIVKTVIKHVNGNGRLATLIGNRKLNFGY